MNRYDWLIWVFRLVIESGAIDEARRLIASLEDVDGDGLDKRRIVEDAILPAVKAGGVYVARALIELILGQVRGQVRS